MRLLISILIGLVFSLWGCAPSKEAKKEIVIWHWMSDRQSAFEELAKRYQVKTGIKVRFEVFFPPDVYSQKIQAAAAAKDLPDLFGVLGERKVFADFIKSGYVENLAPYMEENENEWKNRFIEAALRFNSFEEGNTYGVPKGIYGVPLDMMSIQFLYNKKLLDKAGFSVPKTWDEFINTAKIASQKLGVYGFVCGWGESWFIYCLVTNYAFNVMGKDKFFATLRGNIPYTDPDWIKVFSLFKDLKDAKILAPGIVTLNNKEAEQTFSNNKALFSFNGSWGVNTYSQINPDLQYGVMLPPALRSKYSPKIWAGVGSSFVVNPASRMKEEAIKFLKWLTAKEQQIFLIKKTRNLPSLKGLESEIEPAMAKFLKNMDNSTHPNLWPLNEKPKVVEAINTGIQKIIIGESNPEQVSEEVEKVKKLTLQK